MDCYKHPESCRTQGHHDHNDDGNHHAVNGNHIACRRIRVASSYGTLTVTRVSAEELDLPFIMTRKQDDPAELDHRNQDDTPVYVPGGRRRRQRDPRTYQEEPQQIKRGQASKVRDQDEQ